LRSNPLATVTAPKAISPQARKCDVDGRSVRSWVTSRVATETKVRDQYPGGWETAALEHLAVAKTFRIAGHTLYSIDETGLFYRPKSGRIRAKKGEAVIFSQSAASKVRMTVVLGYGVTPGNEVNKLPLQFVIKGVTNPKNRSNATKAQKFSATPGVYVQHKAWVDAFNAGPIFNKFQQLMPTPAVVFCDNFSLSSSVSSESTSSDSSSSDDEEGEEEEDEGDVYSMLNIPAERLELAPARADTRPVAAEAPTPALTELFTDPAMAVALAQRRITTPDDLAFMVLNHATDDVAADFFRNGLAKPLNSIEFVKFTVAAEKALRLRDRKMNEKKAKELVGRFLPVWRAATKPPAGGQPRRPQPPPRNP
jgi:hypothetical protein